MNREKLLQQWAKSVPNLSARPIQAVLRTKFPLAHSAPNPLLTCQWCHHRHVRWCAVLCRQDVPLTVLQRLRDPLPTNLPLSCSCWTISWAARL